MKKMTVLRTILILTLTAFLLYGCGNSKDEAPAKEVPEVVTEEEVTEEPEKEEEQEAQQPAKEETSAEEEVAEEPKEEETSTDMPEAQVTTTAKEVGGLLTYMESLDPQKPAIIIYNEDDGGTIVNIQEGQHYSLKKGDQIVVNECWDFIKGSGYNAEIVLSQYDRISNYAIRIYPDYTKFDQNQEFFYMLKLTDSPDEEPLKLTCYLTAPAE